MKLELYPHQVELVTDVQQSLDEGLRSGMIVSPAGSGKSVMIAAIVQTYVERGKHVWFMVHRKELTDQITTTLETYDIDLTAVTIMSVLKLKNRLDQLPTPDLIITDESHHSKAKTYEAIYQYHEDVPRIGFTATPTRLSGEGFEDIYERLFVGKSVHWLIQHGYLAPFRYYSVPMLDRKNLKKHSGEFTNQSISNALEKGGVFGKVVETYVDKAAGKQAILYAHTVEYSKKYAALFREQGISALHVDSKTPKAEREEIMTAFKQQQFQILCNVDLISEGFNVPECPVVLLLRPTQSLTVFIQQSMRSMRYMEGKEAVIIDHVGNYVKHGLPDTEREWTLEGAPLTEETELEVCSSCEGLVAQWINQSTETMTIWKCPLCGEVFLQEKEKREADLDEYEGTVEEINPNTDEIRRLKNLGDLDPTKFPTSLYTIVTIFLARNEIAYYYSGRYRYKFPLHYALHYSLDHDGEITWDDLDEIEREYGEQFGITAKQLYGVWKHHTFKDGKQHNLDQYMEKEHALN